MQMNNMKMQNLI